jgi:hypothetical protein
MLLTLVILDIPYGGIATKMSDISIIATDSPFFHTPYPVYFRDLAISRDEINNISTFLPAEYSNPVLYWNTRWASKLQRVDIISLEGENPVHVAGLDCVGSAEGFPLEFEPRGYFLDIKYAPFRGILADGSFLASGKYKYVLRLAKPFADFNKGREYETFESEPFILDMTGMQ